MIIGSVSGGKDSAAMALHLLEERDAGRIEGPIEWVFNNVGWDHPDLYGHLDYLEGKIGPIRRLTPRLPDLPPSVLSRVEEIEAVMGIGVSAMVRLAVHKGLFPGRTMRWCTDLLKVQPFLEYVETLDCDVVNAVGVRAEESARRSVMVEREPMRSRGGAELPGIEVWRPILRWTEAQVIEMHHRHGVAPCPLYLRGAERVGCWPCVMARKAELAMLAKDDRRVRAIRMIEALVGEMARERKERDGETLEGWSPPRLFQRRAADKAGKYPCIPIDDVLDWATGYGQTSIIDLVGGGDRDGCYRWGMCDTGTKG